VIRKILLTHTLVFAFSCVVLQGYPYVHQEVLCKKGVWILKDNKWPL